MEKSICIGESHQLALYTKWLECTYCRVGRLNGLKRNILPKTITNGAQYLLIDYNPATNGLNGNNRCFPMSCALPDETLRVDRNFSDEIIDFLKFKTGRTFDDYKDVEEEYKDQTGDWSKMV